MRKFFINKKDNKIIFSLNDQKHLRVIRTRIGKQLSCYDQNGNELLVKIINDNPYEGISVSEKKKNLIEPYNITCFMGIIKKNNFELVVEKMNELNIKKIIPVYFERSQSNISINYERINKIIFESCKQANRFKGIEICESISFEQLIEELKKYDISFFAYENSKNNIHFSNDDINKKNISFIIGPEGGFSKKEFEVLNDFCNTIKLTNTILKSETAAIFLASCLIERYFINEK